MVKGNKPRNGIQIGQRWLCTDSQSTIIIEITKNYSSFPGDSGEILGQKVQNLYGDNAYPFFVEYVWTYNVYSSPCEYTYLEGQDKP
jgi:hypothetical protein